MSDSPIPSYPKVYNMGHPQLAQLFDGPVVVQEKVDGSQFSFGMLDGELEMRSKGAKVYPETTDKLFAPAVATVMELASQLIPNAVYRGEVVSKPKHNTLSYGRTPTGFIILFDIEKPGSGQFFSPIELHAEARRLGLEAVPSIDLPIPPTADDVRAALQTESVLGGQLIEGVVIKNHNRWGVDGKFLAGKHVSEAFKETHKKAWRESNPNKQEVIEKLIDELRSPARWAKAVQHLRERGELTGTPKDIGPLIKEVQADLLFEEREYIETRLYEWAAPKIARGASGGVAEWYKQQLLDAQFETGLLLDEVSA